MSESRNPRHPTQGDVDAWRREFDELELRMDALRGAFLDGVHAFALTDDLVKRIHDRFDDVGEQVRAMHCLYPFGGVPGRDACRLEPEIGYESAAAPEPGARQAHKA